MWLFIISFSSYLLLVWGIRVLRETKIKKNFLWGPGAVYAPPDFGNSIFHKAWDSQSIGRT